MHDPGFLEDLADRDKALLAVKLLGVKLGVEHRAMKAAAARTLDQEEQQAPADAGAASLAHHGHPADRHAVAVRDHPSASDRPPVFQRQRMNRARIVLVQLDFLGHALFFDKHPPAERPRLGHARSVAADLEHDDLRAAAHRICTTARKWLSQTARSAEFCSRLNARDGIVLGFRARSHANSGAAGETRSAMANDADRASDEQILEAAEMVLAARYPIALTGAGMSVESGIPPFRGPGGLWTKYGEPPMNGYQIFLADPKKGWEDRIRRQDDELFAPLKVAEPNPGHRAFAELERMGVLRFLITQNVDDLHRRAGHRALAEIHGNWKLIRCLECGRRFPAEQISLKTLPPPCPQCRGLLKADTVAFGEPIPPDVLRECAEHSARADLVILGGTSATVYPAAGFAIEVKERGGKLIEVNLYNSEITALCDLSLRGGAADVMPRLSRAIAERRRARMS